MPTKGLWTLVGILLVLAAVPPLLVPVYAKDAPRLIGFPFFFWFQFALVIFAVVLTTIAYFLAKTAYRRDREASGRPAKGGDR